MKSTPIIAPTTAAVASQVSVATNLVSITVLADLLATTETVSIYVLAGTTWLTYVNNSGTAIKLTATVPFVVLPAGPVYGFTKSATAGACGVYTYAPNETV